MCCLKNLVFLIVGKLPIFHVFENISEMSVAKNYYPADLFLLSKQNL